MGCHALKGNAVREFARSTMLPQRREFPVTFSRQFMNSEQSCGLVLQKVPRQHQSAAAPSWNNSAENKRFHLRRTKANRARASAASQDFFQTDIVEYGSRYNRPDRFPRLRQAGKDQRATDVFKWMEQLVATASSAGVQGLEVPVIDQAVVGEEWEGRVAEFNLLVKKGRLEEAFKLIEAAELPKPDGTPTNGAAQILEHSNMILSAVDAGDIALAFEYAGLLPAAIGPYNLLMAVYAVRADKDAVILGLNTAKRRKIQPDPLAYLILIAAAAQERDITKGSRWFAEATEFGYFNSTSFQKVFVCL